ncbi:MAG: ORF6N domain-containing protein [Bacteroidota bacterium]|nr:ORF6N domain-containing protein [Bacteroidota bacterium]
MNTKTLIPIEIIEQRIFLIRGNRVMFDKDIAYLYGVQTRDLNKAVKRNIDRFPSDFMFQLSEEEFQNLMFHFGTSKKGGTRKLPFAFTEQGIAMLSSVLRSKQAIQVNIIIMRAFVKIRQVLLAHKDIEQKLFELEQKIKSHDNQIRNIFEAIRQLMTPPEKPKRQIGFRVEEPKQKYSVRRKR